jgi:hypothetical protein
MSFRTSVAVAFCAILLAGTAQADESAGAVAGGWERANPADQDVIDAATHAVAIRGQESGEKVALLSVEEVSRQVVAGSNYRLVMVIESSTGRKKATAKIWVQSWLNKYELTEWSYAQ